MKFEKPPSSILPFEQENPEDEECQYCGAPKRLGNCHYCAGYGYKKELPKNITKITETDAWKKLREKLFGNANEKKSA